MSDVLNMNQYGSKVFSNNTPDTKLFTYNKQLEEDPTCLYDETPNHQENLLVDLYNFLYEYLDYYENINYILNNNAHFLIIKSVYIPTRDKYKLTDDIVNIIGLYITHYVQKFF